jgi:hypothetical protein
MTATQREWHRSITDQLITAMGLTPAFVRRFQGSNLFYESSKISDVVRMLRPEVYRPLVRSTSHATAADTQQVHRELNVNVSDDFGLMLQQHAAMAAIALLLKERIDSLDLDCEATEIDWTLLHREGDRVTREWLPWMREMAHEFIRRFGLNAENTGHEPDSTARFGSRYKPLSSEVTDAIKREAQGLSSAQIEQLGWLTMSGNTADFQEALIALGIDLSRCNTAELYLAAAQAELFQCVMWLIPRT